MSSITAMLKPFLRRGRMRNATQDSRSVVMDEAAIDGRPRSDLEARGGRCVLEVVWMNDVEESKLRKLLSGVAEHRLEGRVRFGHVVAFADHNPDAGALEHRV